MAILLITDPESLSTDSEYRMMQQHSFSEQRFDLWADAALGASGVPVFETAELGQAAASRFADIELAASPLAQENALLDSLTLEPGQEHCLYLHLFNKKSEVNAPYAGPVPLRIALFWDDRLGQVLDYDLLADAPDNVVLPLLAQAPTQAGSHQFEVVVFSFPRWSQFNSVGQRTGFPFAAYSRRVLVEVQP